jgi:hypothetical protein
MTLSFMNRLRDSNEFQVEGETIRANDKLQENAWSRIQGFRELARPNGLTVGEIEQANQRTAFTKVSRS